MIIFRRPYIRVRENDYGYDKFSIVMYEKIPYLMMSKVLEPEEARKKGYQIESVPAQYKYRLIIDLWLVILRFNWTGKNKFKK